MSGSNGAPVQTYHRRAPRELVLSDIADARAYERERDAFRSDVMAMKRLRRVAIGPIVTMVFENAETVRFQVQEMARAEKILTDEGIQQELDVYNRLLPAPGELSATLFIELTSEAALRHWLPLLVGIERSVRLEVGPDPDRAAPVAGVPEAAHAQQLTREESTSAVHYLRFPVDAATVNRFGAGPVTLAVVHPEYEARSALDDATRAALLADLEGRH